MKLHTAKVYDVKLTGAIASGSDAQSAFFYIFCRFEIANNIDNEYHGEYEMDREDLVRLKNDIINRTEYFTENEEYVKEHLSKAKMTVGEFVEALDKLITTSDQNNDYVLLSWY